MGHEAASDAIGLKEDLVPTSCSLLERYNPCILVNSTATSKDDSALQVRQYEDKMIRKVK